MYQEKIVQILSDKEYEAELQQRGARVIFENVLKVRGLGDINGMVKFDKIEVHPDMFRDVKTLTISASDAQIIVQYMLDSDNN